MSGVISITVVAWDDRVFPVQLDAAENLATLQAIIEAESGVPTGAAAASANECTHATKNLRTCSTVALPHHDCGCREQRHSAVLPPRAMQPSSSWCCKGARCLRLQAARHSQCLAWPTGS